MPNEAFPGVWCWQLLLLLLMALCVSCALSSLLSARCAHTMGQSVCGCTDIATAGWCHVSARPYLGTLLCVVISCVHNGIHLLCIPLYAINNIILMSVCTTAHHVSVVTTHSVKVELTMTMYCRCGFQKHTVTVIACAVNHPE